MVISMTGYGSNRAKGPEAEVDVSVRSLNGRFLDVRCHLPREYAGIEKEIKKLASQILIRGTVDVYVQRKPLGDAASDLIVNVGQARRWAKAAESVAKVVGKKAEWDLGLILSQSDVISWRSKDVPAREVKLVLTALEKALKACATEREREGRAAHKHLGSLFRKLIELTVFMEKMAGRAREEMSRRLDERLKKSPVTEKIEPTRLSQELALYLDRADVEEEIHRLKQHLTQCTSLLDGAEPPGKKLDFYVQELHREVNTIGSKSPLTEMTEAVVDAKALIEQIKEQVQNIV